MTNKDYILKEHIDDIIDAIIEHGSCELCRKTGCHKYCNSPESAGTCEETLEEWLGMEHSESN